MKYFFCSFNQADKNAIVKGVKGVFTLDQVLTGPELCARVGVDFATIQLIRQRHQIENREYFVQQLLAIPSVKELVQQNLSTL